MSIDVLINIVILFIIVASLLKRVQEISKKGDEVKKVPEGPPDPLAETIREAQRQSETQDHMNRRSIREVFTEPERKPSTQQQHEEMPSAPPSIEEMFRRLSGEISPEVQEIVPEPAKAEIIPPEPLPEQPVMVPRARKKTGRPRIQSSGLSFGGSEVVRGIILSEILGPPISMRSERTV